MLFTDEDLQVFKMDWGWQRVDTTRKLIIPKLKILADKLECLVTEIYGSDVLVSYGHKSVPSSADEISGYTNRVRRDQAFNTSRNNLSDVVVGITPNAKNTKVRRAIVNSRSNKTHYETVYGELGIDVSDIRGIPSLGIRFGISSWARAIYHQEVYRAYANNVEKLEVHEILFDICPEDSFLCAYLPNGQNRCHAEDIDEPLNPDLLKDGFAFMLFGERFPFDENLDLEDFADIVAKGAAIFPLLDVFVRQASNLPIDEIDYKGKFFDWWNEYSDLYFKSFDLTSETSGNESKGERLTRELFEKICRKPFIKDRPKWLCESKNGKPLELDGYNQELKLAFEYQGEQHYSFIPLFHGKIENFHKQQSRDEAKLEICKQHGVALVQIPHHKAGNRQFILDELQSLGYSFD